MPAHHRTRPSTLHQEPEAITWAREKAGLTKRALAELVGISEQLMGEIESGWRSATPANLLKIAEALNCPVVVVERTRGAAVVSARRSPVMPATPAAQPVAYDRRLRELEAAAFRIGRTLGEHSERLSTIAERLDGIRR